MPDITMFSTFFISKIDIGLQSHKMLECEIFGGHHLHIKMVHNFELKLFTVVYHFQPIKKMLAYFTMLIHSQHDQPWPILLNSVTTILRQSTNLQEIQDNLGMK